MYARNLDTGKEVVVDKQEDANVRTMPRGPYLAIWGDKVVWSSLRATKEGKIISVIMVEDLATRVRKVIARSTWPEAMGYVDLYEDEVVWSKGSLVNGKPKANVFSYNLSSGELKQVTHDNVSGQPQIWGKWLVWRQGFDDHGPIIIENRRSGQRHKLSMIGRWPRLGENLLLFSYYDTNYVYELDKNEIQPVSREKYNVVALVDHRDVALLLNRPVSENPVYYKGVIEVRMYSR